MHYGKDIMNTHLIKHLKHSETHYHIHLFFVTKVTLLLSVVLLNLTWITDDDVAKRMKFSSIT